MIDPIANAAGRTNRLLVVGTVAILAMLMTVDSGCGPSPVHLTVAEQDPGQQPVSYDDRSWATVLRENVKDGLVDYDHLATHHQPLDDYRQIIAGAGPNRSPDKFPTRESRLCFYINAYNAGVLAAVLHAKIPATVHGYRFGSLEGRYHLSVGGRSLKLAQIRRLVMQEAAGDMRVVFALCDAAMGSPPLHDQPFRPDGLDEQLRQVAQKAMDNHHIVAVDHEHQTLNMATWLATRRNDFIAYYRRRTGSGQATMLNVTLHFAGRVRRDWLNTAVGYPERMIPFDRALNRWTRHAGREG